VDVAQIVQSLRKLLISSYLGGILRGVGIRDTFDYPDERGFGWIWLVFHLTTLFDKLVELLEIAAPPSRVPDESSIF
jgi:hypothetical protein